MPTSVGPNTFGEENLVFGYDTGDTANSYRGEPTTNLASLDLSNAKWYSEGGTKVLQSETLDGYPVYRFRSSGSLIYVSPLAFNQLTATSNDVTLSAYFRNVGTSAQTVNVFLANDFGTDSNGDPNNRSIPADGKWYRQSWTRYAAANTYNQVEFRTFSDTLLISKPQVEYKKHATPPVEGTRSATQGLIDLKGTSTIDLTNVSFDSNAQMTFDGTDDFIQASEYTVPATGPFTVEFVYRRSTAGGRGGLFERNPSSPYNGMSLGQGGTNAWGFTVSDNFNGTILTADFTYPTQNIWYHDVGVFNGTNTVSAYRNGVQVDSTTGGTVGNLNTQGTRDKLLIMKRDNFSSTVGGDVALVKIYNRALTASEIKANYNAIKGRFNI